MQSRLRLAIALLVVAVTTSAGGCAKPEAPSGTAGLSEPTAMDLKRSDMHRLSGLMDALEREGLRVKESTSAADPGVFSKRDATYYAFSVDDGVVRVYLVDTEDDVATLKSRVSPDGSRFGEVNVSWIGRPRLFESGGIIVLYLEDQQEPAVSAGTDQKVLKALTSLMGEPFASAP